MSFYYLATSYSHHPGGPEAAFQMAAEVAARLIEHGIPVYSPIAHTQPISKYLEHMDPLDYKVWEPLNLTMVEASRGCIVWASVGWENSAGVRAEINWFVDRGRPVFMVNDNWDLIPYARPSA